MVVIDEPVPAGSKQVCGGIWNNDVSLNAYFYQLIVGAAHSVEVISSGMNHMFLALPAYKADNEPLKSSIDTCMSLMCMITSGICALMENVIFHSVANMMVVSLTGMILNLQSSMSRSYHSIPHNLQYL